MYCILLRSGFGKVLSSYKKGQKYVYICLDFREWSQVRKFQHHFLVYIAERSVYQALALCIFLLKRAFVCLTVRRCMIHSEAVKC